MTIDPDARALILACAQAVATVALVAALAVAAVYLLGGLR